jgi:hypothetical protein
MAAARNKIIQNSEVHLTLTKVDGGYQKQYHDNNNRSIRFIT